jgi:hypothetical protein
MPERTQIEIEAEIKALEACKTYIPRRTTFGDDNHKNVDLQIEELRDGIDDTADEWNDYSDGEQSSIMEARYWKEGDEDESPSSGWDNYKPDAKKRAKA